MFEAVLETRAYERKTLPMLFALLWHGSLLALAVLVPYLTVEAIRPPIDPLICVFTSTPIPEPLPIPLPLTPHDLAPNPVAAAAADEAAVLPPELVADTAPGQDPAGGSDLAEWLAGESTWSLPGAGPGIGSGPGGSPGGGPGGEGSPGVPGGDDGVAQGPLTPGGAVSMPVLVFKVAPEYPPLARSVRLSGSVTLRAVIGADGSVRPLEILRSTSPLFDQAALDAVARWRYRPALRTGRPVDVYLTVTVEFTLR